jgi:hypothetical protein
MGHVPRAVGGGEAVVRDPVDLRDGGVHVGAGADGGGEEEAVGGEPERIRRPPVPGLCARVPRVERELPVRGVVEHVPEPEVAVVDHLGGDALAVHVGEAQDGVVQTVVVLAVGLGDLGQRGAPALARHEEDRRGVHDVVLAQRGDELVEARVEVLAPELLGHTGVRIGRDDDHLVVHGPSLPGDEVASMAAGRSSPRTPT